MGSVTLSHSAARLTSFALISALEEDLRTQILALSINEDISGLTEELRDKSNTRRMRDGLSATVALHGILDYLDLGDSQAILSANRGRLNSEQVAALEELNSVLSRLIGIRNRVAHSRPMELDDPAFLIDLAQSLSESARNEYTNLTATLKRLGTDPSYVLGLTMSLPKDSESGPQHNLPIPDYDETGFFGRKDEIRQIRRAINGPYPVISIIGDGGIGKTSIALKVAYEFLEEEKFEAIVWATAKSTMLNVNEITRIQGAIESSLGLMNSAARQLGGGGSASPMEEVLEYLESFRVLLILDNLETVLDESLKSFLRELPIGSKVIITSRIGVGSTELPIRLGPLANNEASNLLRRLAKSRNVESIKNSSQKSITRWANAMDGHPAYIRWFVSGVQSGRRPEDLLRNNSLLLDFCMSNVYSFLSDDARELLTTMLIVQGTRTQSELAFLTDSTAENLQKMLFELLNTNFVLMTNGSSENSLDTLYGLSDFARNYLSQHHGASATVTKKVMSKRDELNSLGKAFSNHGRNVENDPHQIAVRGAPDYPVAKMLRDALNLSGENRFEEALKLCSECQQLSPGFREPWRIEGLIQTIQGNQQDAALAFERALECDPESMVLNLLLGNWFVNSGYSPPRGLELLQKAARLDRDSITVISSVCWAHFLMGNYEDSFSAAQGMTQMELPMQKKLAAFEMGIRSGVAEMRRVFELSDFDSAMEWIELLIDLCDSHTEFDSSSVYMDGLLLSAYFNSQVEKKSTDYPQRRASMVSKERLGGVSKTERLVGKVTTDLQKERGFVFVRTDEGDVFSHVRDFISEGDWEAVQRGDICVLGLAPDRTRGLRADQVRRYI